MEIWFCDVALTHRDADRVASRRRSICLEFNHAWLAGRFGGPKGISKMRCCRKPSLKLFFRRTACGLFCTFSD
jgi:hypothetical protein